MFLGLPDPYPDPLLLSYKNDSRSVPVNLRMRCFFRKTETNKQYGMVSAESKKDKRTVEQVQAEIRAKKLKRLEVG